MKSREIKKEEDVLTRNGLPTIFSINFIIEDDEDGQKKMEFLDDLRCFIFTENDKDRTIQNLIARKSKLVIEVVPNKLFIQILGIGRFTNSILVRKFIPDEYSVDISSEELSLVKIYGYYKSSMFELVTTPEIEYGMSMLPMTINGQEIKVIGVNPYYGVEEQSEGKHFDIERLMVESIREERLKEK